MATISVQTEVAEFEVAEFEVAEFEVAELATIRRSCSKLSNVLRLRLPRPEMSNQSYVVREPSAGATAVMDRRHRRRNGIQELSQA